MLTGLLVKERRTFPSRLTTIFLVKIVLVNVTVLLGASVDYRIPNPINTFMSKIDPSLTLMSDDLCKAQAILYQFLIWCILGFWVILAFCLYKVVHSTAETVNFRRIEIGCYVVVYGVAAFFTIVPIIVDQSLSDDVRIFKADNTMLWCWLTAENATGNGTGYGFVPWSQVCA